MKKVFLLVLALALTAPYAVALADGCYMCKDGKYVKYEGDETFAKRKEAKEKFQCDVSGTTGSCQASQTKGTVSDKK
ncbi:MAG: hypothetical protein COV46_07600 [Deltaproteobacteria bacterium CG11_big_fil_rev_8_21_14_0_20_49_13]|nr:MAG: hypothetical protein COV46_07600 [Deltaproteobacteria bacterium CG11_big_fil_rev_8_21_14_0_20_49_13]